LIKHEHEPVAIAKTRQVVDGAESNGIVEDVLDSSECVYQLWDSGSHRAGIRVSISDALPGQVLLHVLGSEEGEAAVDRVLKDQFNACLQESAADDLRKDSDGADDASRAWVLRTSKVSMKIQCEDDIIPTFAAKATIIRITHGILISPGCKIGRWSTKPLKSHYENM
jgi:hypothetical protein